MINICFVSNDNYVPYIETLIVSILKNSDDDDFFHFHIIEDDISKESKDKINKLKEIKNFELDFYTPPQENREKYKKWVEYVKTKNIFHWNYTIYYKLEILFLLKDLDKVLFLDADSIAINNIKNIYKKDVENYYSIVSQFKHQNFNKTYPKLYKWVKEVIDNDDSDENPNYLVSGVMLFNLKKIREEIPIEKLKQQISYCFDKYKDIIFSEEHFFMYLFKNKILYEDIGLDEWTNNKVNFVSIYFSSPIGKPLSKDFNKPINEYFYKFWEYFRQTYSFKENTEKYLNIYYDIKSKEEKNILIQKFNKVIDKIVWYIPIRKLRDSIREKLQKSLEI